MYVCVCHAVTEQSIRRAVDDGLRSIRELRDHLGVAGSCGRCANCARNVVRESLGGGDAICTTECRQSCDATPAGIALGTA
jgi:bacterioferritin-associated ferredoxin